MASSYLRNASAARWGFRRFDTPETEATLLAEYRYDGRNRRVEKILAEASSEPGSVAYYHNHAWQVLEERFFDDEQELERVYQNVWSPRYIDALILRDACDPATGAMLPAERLFYLADANYNVTGVVRENPASPGEWHVVERYVYDPYGRVAVLNGDPAGDPDGLAAPEVYPAWSADPDGRSDRANRTLYTGRELDPESGLMYYRARYYDAGLSTFVARDPIGYASGDFNLYLYVRNRALLSVDPLGLMPPAGGFAYPALESANVTHAKQYSQEVAAARKVLETLCDCECLECSRQDCLAEAATIARAYVDMFYAKTTWRLRPGAWLFGDYRHGWMCYQWQTHTYNALQPVVSAGKCFDIRRVGLVTHHYVPAADFTHFIGAGFVVTEHMEAKSWYTLDHNWVAISAVRKIGTSRDAAPAGECTVYLDPWLGGEAGVYPAVKDSHVIHNFLATTPWKDVEPGHPGGMSGIYLPDPKACDGEFGPWFW